MGRNGKRKFTGYSKAAIDKITGNGFQKTCQVSLQRLSEEDIDELTSRKRLKPSKKNLPKQNENPEKNPKVDKRTSKIRIVRPFNMTKYIEDSGLAVYNENIHSLLEGSKFLKKDENSSDANDPFVNEIENLYTELFSMSVVKDNIVIIGNIVYLILKSRQRKNKIRRKIVAAGEDVEKCKKLYDINLKAIEHKKILDVKLGKYFEEIISQIDNFDFKSSFIIVFLNIMMVIGALEGTKFDENNNNMIRNLVPILQDSLLNSEVEIDNVFSMLRSKKLERRCINILRIIQTILHKNCNIPDYMKQFFISSANYKKYFEAVSNAVIRCSDENLTLLIDTAATKCRALQCETTPVTSQPAPIQVTEPISPSDYPRTVGEYTYIKIFDKEYHIKIPENPQCSWINCTKDADRECTLCTAKLCSTLCQKTHMKAIHGRKLRTT